MKKIVIVSQFFYPYNSTSTPKIITELAEDLVESGAKVEVITSKLNYNAELIKNIASEEVIKEIKIKRVWSTLGEKNKPIMRILNYITFLLSLFICLMKKDDYDEIILLSNPPILPLIGVFIKKFKKKEFIYLIHDVYPDIAIKLGVIKKKSFASKLMSYINEKAFKYAKKIVVLGRDMQNLIESKGVNKDKIEIIHNWADSKTIYPINKSNIFSKSLNIDKTFNVIYTGNIGRFHDMETLIEAANQLKNQKDIKFIIIGEGFKKKKILELKNIYNLENLIVLGYQDEKIYNSVLSTADLLVATLEEGVEGMAVPSKTYSYLAANKAIVAIMDFKSEIAQVVKENNIGICVEKGEYQKLSNYILNLKVNVNEQKEITDRVRNVFEKNYERKIVTKKFKELLQV